MIFEQDQSCHDQMSQEQSEIIYLLCKLVFAQETP